MVSKLVAGRSIAARGEGSACYDPTVKRVMFQCFKMGVQRNYTYTSGRIIRNSGRAYGLLICRRMSRSQAAHISMLEPERGIPTRSMTICSRRT